MLNIGLGVMFPIKHFKIMRSTGVVTPMRIKLPLASCPFSLLLTDYRFHEKKIS